MGLTVDTSSLDAGMTAFPVKMAAALKIYGETVSKKLEAQAKLNRPWTDRTNRARLGLTGSSDIESDGLHIVLAHTVDYGVYLELAHEMRYAIVAPTVKKEANDVKNGLARFLDKVVV